MPEAAATLPLPKPSWRRWLEIAVNTVLFKVAWWACVLGAAWGHPWVGVAFTLPALPLHAWLVGDWRKEATIILSAGAFGYLADSALVVAGLVRFPEHAQLLGPSPLWMVMLWMGFGATVRTALRVLFARPFWSVVVGAVVGPLSYRGGESLDAIWIEKGLPTTLLLAAMWAAAMYGLSMLLQLTDDEDEPMAA